MNRIGGVMVSSAIDLGFETDRVKPMIINLVFVASPLSMQHYGERVKTGSLGIRIMCQKGEWWGRHLNPRTLVSVS